MSGKKDCKFCDKKGLLWLPLRYSVVGSDIADATSALPTLSGKLGKGVTDLPLTQSKYAVRLMRPGYLYVLLDRKGIKYWEAYMVLNDAFLYKFNPEDPPQITPEFSCEPHTCGINASMVAIPEAKDVPKLWALFTPSPLTKAKLADYKTNADKYAGEGKLQTFSPAGWLSGSTAQPHALLAPELLTKVAEYVLFTQPGNPYTSPLGKALGQLLFPASDHAYCGAPPNEKGEYFGRLGSLYNTIKRNGYAAMALYDHIGIAQELNDFRNAPLEGLQHYLAATDEYGASNQQRLQVFEAIEEMRIGFENGIVQSHQAFIDRHREQSDQWFERQLQTAQTLRSMRRMADAEAVEADVERSKKIREENYKKAIAESKASGAKKWAEKYRSRLDTNEIETFKKTLDKNVSKAYSVADKRAPDHLAWFESPRLVNAFDVYDAKNTNSGYSFALQSAICTIGMSGCKSNDAKLDEWINATTVDRKNLYMRGFMYNQDDLIKAAKEDFANIQAASATVTVASSITAQHMLKASKGLVDGFKKIDSAFDEWVRNQGNQEFSKFWSQPTKAGAMAGRTAGVAALQSHGLEIILYHKASEITRSIFRAGLGGAFDKTLTARLSGLLYARLGAVAEKLAYDELMLKVSPEKLAEGYKGRSAERNKELASRKVQEKAGKIAGQVDDSLEGLIADAQEKVQAKVKPTLNELKGNKSPPTNNYHQARIGVLLGCIEMIALGEKLSHFKWDKKGVLEVAGSMMAVGSIVLDTYYSATKSIREIAPYKSINAIKDGADIVRGGFKLGAGVLAFGAGLCAAYLDYMKWDTEKDPALRLIYSLRSATGFVSAGFTIAAAFSYCKPLLEYGAKGYAAHSVRFRILAAAGELAAKLAARVRLLVWVARANLVGLALTAIEIGYLFYKDNALQEWCEKSVFRKDKKYKNWIGRVTTKDFYSDAIKELTELDRAAQEVGVTL